MPDTPQYALPDPDDPILASMRADLNRIQAGNGAKLGEFARLAGPAGMMGIQLDLLNVRVFTLARMIFGDDTPALVQFQLEFERQMAQILDEAVTKVRQAQLGAQMSPQAAQTLGRSMRNGGLLGPDGRPLR